MCGNFSYSRSNGVFLLAFAVALAAILISSTTGLSQTPLLNGSFEDPVVSTGNMQALVPTDWRQTYGNDTINIYRPGAGDAFYGQIPDGDQAVYYTDSGTQELQPGAVGSEGTGIIMEEGVGIRLLFDAVFYGENEGGKIQFNALVDNVAYNTQFFVPNSAVDGFGTFTYEYTPSATDVGKDFSFWCYSTSGTSDFLVDNFRYETMIPQTKPPKPGPVAGGPVIPDGTTPYAWYRSDVGVTPYDGDANTIAWWQDQSGNSRHVESFGDPQITTNGNDGSQVITFDGVGDTLIGDGDAAEWGEATPGTVFAVWKRSSAETGSGFVYDAHLDEQRQFLSINTVSEELQAGGGEYSLPGTWINHLTTDTADPGADEWFVTSVSSTTGVTDTFRINSAEAFNGDLLSGGMSGLRIGSFVLDTHFWEGDIAELIVFEGDLSATERGAIEDELMERWGVEAILPTIPGDANNDGIVNATDAATLASNWMASDVGWGGGDFNDDGVVDDIDATILATNWQVSAAGASVPEPGTLVLLAGMVILLFWQRKR